MKTSDTYRVMGLILIAVEIMILFTGEVVEALLWCNLAFLHFVLANQHELKEKDNG